MDKSKVSNLFRFIGSLLMRRAVRTY